MKKQQSSQPDDFVRKSNEEILEAMKQAMKDAGGNPKLTEILLKLFTYPPQKDDVVLKVFDEITLLNLDEYYTKTYGGDKHGKRSRTS